MKALASGTSAAAVVAGVTAVSPQQPGPPQQPEASENSCSYVWVTSTETSSKPASLSSFSYSSFSRAPETQPDHASMLRTSSSGSLPLSPKNTMSETANLPPGLRTRNASEITLGLSVERLMTQLEITTSTWSSGSGISSMCPFRNSTFSTPAWALFFSASSSISSVMSRPYALPPGETLLAESSTSMPPPLPKSRTTSPGKSVARDVGLPHPKDAAPAAWGSPSRSSAEYPPPVQSTPSA